MTREEQLDALVREVLAQLDGGAPPAYDQDIFGRYRAALSFIETVRAELRDGFIRTQAP